MCKVAADNLTHFAKRGVGGCDWFVLTTTRLGTPIRDILGYQLPSRFYSIASGHFYVGFCKQLGGQWLGGGFIPTDGMKMLSLSFPPTFEANP